MNKSKSMAVAAAVLTMCMAGSAFAQDPRFDRSPDRYHRNDRQGQQFHRQDGPNHGDYQRRPDFRPGPQYGRPAYQQYPRAEWRRGGHLPGEYRGRRYVVDDWRGQRLYQPPQGYQWVGVGGDFVLAAVATGLIAQIIAGQ